MKVSFVYDAGNADGTKGGAELTMEEFARNAPDTVEWVEPHEADTIVIGNCVTVNPEIIGTLIGRNAWRYHHDLARREDTGLRAWLDDAAQHIFTSPLHRDRYGGHDDAHLIPPAVDLDMFRPNRQTRRHLKREGICTVGSWQNPGKGGFLVAETCARNGVPLDVYGPGAFPPDGPHINYFGEINPGSLPAVFHKYEQFIFTPVDPEPFGRCVVEAWAAECEVLVNDLVGAKWWIENEPDKLRTATEDFWGLILD